MRINNILFVEGESLKASGLRRLARARAAPPPLRAPLLLALRRRTRAQMRTLVRAQGEQIFRFGTFHADPHPGNQMITPRGDVALIDFGCCKALSAVQRTTLARLVVALADGDDDAAVAAVRAMGFATRRSDRAVALDFARYYFDENRAAGATARGGGGGGGGGLLPSPPHFTAQLNRRDPIRAMPEEYMLVARASLLLRGLAAKLRVPLSCADAWSADARAWLAEADAAAAAAERGAPPTAQAGVAVRTPSFPEGVFPPPPPTEHHHAPHATPHPRMLCRGPYTFAQSRTGQICGGITCA